jgi:predicted acyltransferase
VAASLLLVFQSAILLGVGAPGVPPGSLDVNNNIAGWVDSRVFGSSHLIYDNFDQEGLIAVINGTAMVMLGLACGRTLRLTKHDWDSVKYLIVGGTIALALGLIIIPLLPLIKQLWTASYILVNAGLGAIILAILYGYIDLLERGRILKLAVPFGRNALFIYIVSQVLGPTFFINRFLHQTIVSILGLDMGVLAFGLISVTFLWVVAYLLHLRHIYIKL